MEYKESDDEEEDEDDMDHDEIILGNTTDVIISMSKAMGPQFLPILQELLPHLYPYVGDDHPSSD